MCHGQLMRNRQRLSLAQYKTANRSTRQARRESLKPWAHGDLAKFRRASRVHIPRIRWGEAREKDDEEVMGPSV